MARLADLDHPRAGVRDDAFGDLSGALVDEDGVLVDAAQAVEAVAELVHLVRSPRARGFAAALLLDVLAAAREGGERPVLAAGAALREVDTGGFDPRIREALHAAAQICEGTSTVSRDELDARREAAAACCPPAEPPATTDVLAWYRGAYSVGDFAPEVVVPLLVDVAFEGDVALELLAPGVPADARAGRVLGAAHRSIFHAVLAWRSGREAVLPPRFPSHREHDRALASWVAAAQGRDPVLVGRLIALAGCTTAEGVRAREAAHDLVAIEFPEGDAL